MVPRTRSSPDGHRGLALMVALAMILMLDHDNHILRFLHQYPQWFASYYAPKLQWAMAKFGALMDELPDELWDAWDLSILIIVAASLHHLIDSCRLIVLKRLQ